MADYKEMYLALFQAATQAVALLQEAQMRTKEIYLSAELPDIRAVSLSKPDPGACRNEE